MPTNRISEKVWECMHKQGIRDVVLLNKTWRMVYCQECCSLLIKRIVKKRRRKKENKEEF